MIATASAATGAAPAPAAGAPLITVTDLHRTYRQGAVDIHALRGVDLTVGQGEFTVLTGPSGSGKSTLLNVIGCLDKPTAGRVVIDGTDVTHLGRNAGARFRLARLGFVFQAYNLVPVLTAYENAEYTLALQGVPKARRRALVEPLMARVGLADLMHRKPHELSGGQQQRVAVVRALASRPALVLADEPTANLDSATSTSLLDLLLELQAEHGITFLLASHDALLVARARRVVRLLDGRVDADERRP